MKDRVVYHGAIRAMVQVLGCINVVVLDLWCVCVCARARACACWKISCFARMHSMNYENQSRIQSPLVK